MDPARLDAFGPAIGRGAVWMNDAVKAGEASDPYLFSGYARRSLTLAHGGAEALRVAIEVDRAGDGAFAALREVRVPAGRRARCRWRSPRRRPARGSA